MMTSLRLCLLALALCGRTAAAQDRHYHGADTPKSLRDEHEEIQWALQDAARYPGAIGTAARDLQKVLQPHMVREEQIALPPLGVVRRLVELEDVSGMTWMVPITDAMKNELPHLLEEHAVIAKARVRLEDAARAESNDRVIAFTNQLARHAQTEEDISYPTAVLVGEIVRARLAARPPK
jgi:hypothetical protein